MKSIVFILAIFTIGCKDKYDPLCFIRQSVDIEDNKYRIYTSASRFCNANYYEFVYCDDESKIDSTKKSRKIFVDSIVKNIEKYN